MSKQPQSQNPQSEQSQAELQSPAQEPEEEFGGRLLLFQYMPSWLTSFILHVVIIIALALILIPNPFDKETVEIVAGDPAPSVETPSEINLDPLSEMDNPLESEITEMVSEETFEELSDAPLESLNEEISIQEAMNITDFGMEISATEITGGLDGELNDMEGRNSANRAALLQQAGGNPASESSVVLGLKWIAAHQLPEGNWNFNHQIGPGDHRTSPNPGDYQNCTIAATSMALLAFLGNGQTHFEGDYKRNVYDGLKFLLDKQDMIDQYNGKLMDNNYLGGMYAHGLASITLAEAYAMTKDPNLRGPAQAAINFIVYSQNPNGGGWRYKPKMPGDLSVFGWQLMALKSANMAGLQVPTKTIARATKFLNNASHESGAKYKYLTTNNAPSLSMTGVGLLCRMYMGWKRDNPAMTRGCQYLAERGPIIEGPQERTWMYHNYYATQVMRQFGGDEWPVWNKQMRDYLIETQATEGTAKGSWYFKPGLDSGCVHGGRLYCTTMAVMTLEVYYRFLPIYRDAAAEDEFPLD